MNNPLARQLIQMNQEKIALKTAYKKGAGSSVIYAYTVDVPYNSTGDGRSYRITANVQNSNFAFPLVDAEPDKWQFNSLISLFFSNDGLSITGNFEIYDSRHIYITSTAALTNISGSWSD